MKNIGHGIVEGVNPMSQDMKAKAGSYRRPVSIRPISYLPTRNIIFHRSIHAASLVHFRKETIYIQA